MGMKGERAASWREQSPCAQREPAVKGAGDDGRATEGPDNDDDDDDGNDRAKAAASSQGDDDAQACKGGFKICVACGWDSVQGRSCYIMLLSVEASKRVGSRVHIEGATTLAGSFRVSTGQYYMHAGIARQDVNIFSTMQEWCRAG